MKRTPEAGFGRLARLFLFGPFSLLAGAGCGGGTGTVNVVSYGEAFIEDGIPATDVSDGWSIGFYKFVVTIKDIQVAGQKVPDPAPIDLAVGSGGAGHPLGSFKVEEGAYRNGAFTIARIEVKGSGSKDGTTKTFDWVFDRPTRYDDCDTTTTVADSGTVTFEITVHADHLLLDSLVAMAPSLLFQPLANADTNMDGVIARSELGATSIGAYDPGNEPISTLWQWLEAQARTLGHVDGEGHCHGHAL